MLIFPAIDLLGGRCVRLRQGDYARETVFSDDPAAVARQWVAQGADRLHLVDLDGAKAGRPVNGDVIRRIVSTVGVPCQLGGGIRTDADLEAVFGWGVRWAVLGTKALHEPGWVRRQADRYPARVVLGLDARDGFVATDGWLTTSSTRATDLAILVEDAPLAAVVYTDIARDGMLGGPNFDALAAMTAATRLPVVASGGVSDLDHVLRLAGAGVYGCIIGRALYEGRVTLPEVLSSARAAVPVLHGLTARRAINSQGGS
jgi:phosphoribosylformimino-5-aminoimidazole carboxamide ribotide isomerase